jgi:hypothetical protein
MWQFLMIDLTFRHNFFQKASKGREFFFFSGQFITLLWRITLFKSFSQSLHVCLLFLIPTSKYIGNQSLLKIQVISSDLEVGSSASSAVN